MKNFDKTLIVFSISLVGVILLSRCTYNVNLPKIDCVDRIDTVYVTVKDKHEIKKWKRKYKTLKVNRDSCLAELIRLHGIIDTPNYITIK